MRCGSWAVRIAGAQARPAGAQARERCMLDVVVLRAQIEIYAARSSGSAEQVQMEAARHPDGVFGCGNALVPHVRERQGSDLALPARLEGVHGPAVIGGDGLHEEDALVLRNAAGKQRVDDGLHSLGVLAHNVMLQADEHARIIAPELPGAVLIGKREECVVDAAFQPEGLGALIVAHAEMVECGNAVLEVRKPLIAARRRSQAGAVDGHALELLGAAGDLREDDAVRPCLVEIPPAEQVDGARAADLIDTGILARGSVFPHPDACMLDLLVQRLPALVGEPGDIPCGGGDMQVGMAFRIEERGVRGVDAIEPDL